MIVVDSHNPFLLKKKKGFAPITGKLIQIQNHLLGSNCACAVVSCINFFSKDSEMVTKLRLAASVFICGVWMGVREDVGAACLSVSRIRF